MSEKFYEKSCTARLDALNLSAETRAAFEKVALDATLADNLIENQISEIEIPLGICFIRVDGKDYTVPLATEEPSVIAAANNGAKLAGTFTTLKNTRRMSGQIVFYDVADTQQLTEAIEARRTEIFECAKAAYPSIYKRGGGLVDFTCNSYKGWLSLDCHFDTKDALGANMINTMLEAIGKSFRSWFPAEKLLFSILTNENCECRTIVETRIPTGKKLSQALAEKIVVASDCAQLDRARAATHNKGIMNGIEAAALALGNDTRALNASIYVMAENRGLSVWQIEGDSLVGTMTVSLPVAAAGGATQILPKAKAAHALLGNPDAPTLASILAAVGLANNLAALKALVSDGIQKGHMSLQARSLALSVGAGEDEIESVVKQLIKSPTLNTETAQSILEELKKSSDR